MANLMLEALCHILAQHEGGVYKRIDENREMLETLQREAPALLAKQPWIVHWLKSQDQFLVDLAAAAPQPNAQFRPRADIKPFPRNWPG